jgi:transposase-like protein
MAAYKRFDDQFKSDVINYMETHPDEPMQSIADSFMVAKPTLYKWKNQAINSDGKVSIVQFSTEEEKKRLRKENSDLRMKNEILARASLYISEFIVPKGVTPQ